MKEQVRLATKAQAQAVREYLASLGVSLTHTQALEVIARGQGMRSRHALAAELDKLPTADQWVDANVAGPAALVEAMKNHARSMQPAPTADAVAAPRFTKVCYRYVDGSNCKRYGQMVFRGRLTVDQLKFIQWKLDAGEYFVPVQVGFECLAFAFNDFGGDDHGWHTLELGDPENWTLDNEGYVLRAGDVEQVFDANAGLFATDADCGNLFFRFATLEAWNPEAQTQLLVDRGYVLPERDEDRELDPHEASVAAMWHSLPHLRRCPRQHLEELFTFLRDEGFEPRQDIPNMLEWTREMGPNAYQFVILQECEPEFGDLCLNADVSTNAGRYITETPVLAFTGDADAHSQLARLRQTLDEQKHRALTDPWAWSEDFA